MPKKAASKSRRGVPTTQRRAAEAVSEKPGDAPSSLSKSAAATEKDWDMCDIAQVLESGKYTPHGEKKAVPGHRVAWEPAKDASAEQLAYWTEKEWVQTCVDLGILSAATTGHSPQNIHHIE